MKYISIWMVGCMLLSLGAKAQQVVKLDLQRTIEIANDSSLSAFRYQNLYLSGYWEYRTYKANRLPSLTLDLTPAKYYRYITQRYDSNEDMDVYREQQMFSASGGLSIKQNLDWTGGTFYIDSELDFMRNFGDSKSTQYSSIPVRVGYQQSLLGYNAFRWDRKIEPLKYEKVKKQFIYNTEMVSEEAVTYFFALAMAQADYRLAEENVASSDTLYSIGLQRHKIAAISRADLLTLQLDKVNAHNTLQNAQIALKRAMFSLASFLNLDKNTVIELDIPGRPTGKMIPVDDALMRAKENNPTFLEQRQNVLEAEQNVDKTKKESRFNASFNASVGFNQVADKLGDASKYGCRLQGTTDVAFTVLDVLGYLDEIPVCTGYEIDGKVTTEFPTTTLLEKAKPVLETLPGWKCDIRGIKKYEDLPENCRKYVEFVEKHIGFPITMISNGPGRDDIIYRNK